MLTHVYMHTRTNPLPIMADTEQTDTWSTDVAEWELPDSARITAIEWRSPDDARTPLSRAGQENIEAQDWTPCRWGIYTTRQGCDASTTAARWGTYRYPLRML